MTGLGGFLSGLAVSNGLQLHQSGAVCFSGNLFVYISCKPRAQLFIMSIFISHVSGSLAEHEYAPFRGWRDAAPVKNTLLSCRGSWLVPSMQLQSQGIQPLFWSPTVVECTHTHTHTNTSRHTYIYVLNKSYKIIICFFFSIWPELDQFCRLEVSFLKTLIVILGAPAFQASPPNCPSSYYDLCGLGCHIWIQRGAQTFSPLCGHRTPS